MVALEAIQFVVGKDGQPVAVQVDIELWQRIVDALEDAEDIALAQEALARLEEAGGDPERAGWVNLDSLSNTWLHDDEL